jgi:hypothetical protein
MTERERELLRLALIYLQANRTDVIEFFSEVDCAENEIEVNGDFIAAPTEAEIGNLLMTLQ